MSSGNFQTLVTALQNTVQAVNAITKTIKGAPAQFWAQFASVALTDAASVVLDMGTAINFTLALTSAIGATRVLANPTNAKPGQRGFILVTQSASGGNALTFGANYQAAGGVTALSPSTAANAVNLYTYLVVSANVVALSLLSNLEH